MSGDQRRATIVQSAAELFAQDGFRGTTTRQLAHAAGVSEPVLYMHFATKRELYSAVVEHLAAGEVSEIKSELAANIGVTDDREFFLRLAKTMLDWHLDDPKRGRILFYSALEGHELADLFYQRYILPFYEAFTDCIRRRIDDGVFRAVDPFQAARAFCAMIGNYSISQVIFGHKEDAGAREAALNAMVEIFLNGVRRSQ